MSGVTVTGRWNAAKKCIEVAPVFWDDMPGDGHELTAVITTDRRPDQLKAYWWLLGEIVKSGAWDGDKDSLDDYTRVGVGFGKWRVLSDGRAVFIPDSIALSKCDGTKFDRFMWAAERLWAERLGVDVAELRRRADALKLRQRAAA